jgi:hypothetical protein
LILRLGLSGNGGNLNTEEIIAQIDEEISKLQQAKALLLGNVAVKPNRVGRPKKSPIASRILSVEPAKRVLSSQARASIAAAQKRRWAKKIRSDKKAAHASAVKSVAKALGAKPVKKAAAKKAVKATPVKVSAPTA